MQFWKLEIRHRSRPWAGSHRVECSAVSSQLGPARRCLAGPFEKKGGKYIPPPKFERTNRYNENDGVSKRHGVQELAFGIIICFDS